MDKFVIRQTSTLLDYGVLALYEESDLVLAETALASNIKLLEGMIKGDPDNGHLRLLTAQALAGYSLGFVEDQDPPRAQSLYLRARDHAMHILRENDDFRTNENESLEMFGRAVSSLEADDIGPLFWAAFSWAGWINVSISNPQAFIDLPKVQVMMQRVMDLDETYFLGAPLLFFGSMWGLKPKMLGGDPEKAKEFFDRNLELTDRKFLLTYIYYAKFYAMKTLDEDLFDQLMKKVTETPANVLPEFQLLNVIAKDKAQRLISRRDDYF
jgi:hypothetical protein